MHILWSFEQESLLDQKKGRLEASSERFFFSFLTELFSFLLNLKRSLFPIVCWWVFNRKNQNKINNKKTHCLLLILILLISFKAFQTLESCSSKEFQASTITKLERTITKLERTITKLERTITKLEQYYN